MSNQRNQQLYNLALEALTDMYSDTSVSREDTLSNLKALSDEIDLLISTLRGGTHG